MRQGSIVFQINSNSTVVAIIKISVSYCQGLMPSYQDSISIYVKLSSTIKRTNEQCKPLNNKKSCYVVPKPMPMQGKSVLCLGGV
jgi:hypothetical protein